MRLSLSPIKFKDHRTFDFSKTFGADSIEVIPEEFNFDTSGIMPDQNLDGLPQACTSYTENDIASNEDGLGYYDDQLFTYNNTKLIEGVDGNVPVRQMDALKAGTVYGVKKKNETAEEALKHRRAPYFIIRPTTDYFEALISAMWRNGAGASCGTPWPYAIQMTGSDGIVPSFVAPKIFSSGHCWAAVGVKLVNGEQRIMGKSWQGNRFGDKGYCYFSRDQINGLLSAKGSGCFAQKHAEPGDIRAVEMDIISTILSYFWMILGKMAKNI